MSDDAAAIDARTRERVGREMDRRHAEIELGIVFEAQQSWPHGRDTLPVVTYGEQGEIEKRGVLSRGRGPNVFVMDGSTEKFQTFEDIARAGWKLAP